MWRLEKLACLEHTLETRERRIDMVRCQNANLHCDVYGIVSFGSEVTKLARLSLKTTVLLRPQALGMKENGSSCFGLLPQRSVCFKLLLSAVQPHTILHLNIDHIRPPFDLLLLGSYSETKRCSATVKVPAGRFSTANS